MEMSQYWVGQIPARPLSINVMDSYGRPFGAATYDNYEVVMLDPRNRRVDLSQATLDVGGRAQGRFVFVWPQAKSLFDRPGDYVLQLIMQGPGRKDITTTHTIRVRQIGRINN